VKKVCEPDGGRVIGDHGEPEVTYGFRGTPRTRPNPREEAAGDTAPMNPHHRRSSALAHATAGSFGSGNPRRSVGRSSQTPRDGRYGDRPGRPGTLPPVPGRLTPFLPHALLTAAALAAFALLTWRVAAGGRLIRDDGRVLRAFRDADRAHPALSTPAHLLCDLGDIEVAVPVLLAALAASVLLGRRAGLPRWWAVPAAAALAMCVLPVVVSLVKSGVDRPAPGRVVPDPSYGYFPSGHTATSSVGFGLAALVLLPFLRAAARAALAAGTAVLALAVGAALVWCGYHWPLDVVGSWLLAVALLSPVAAALLVPGAVPGRPGKQPREVRSSSGSPG
jgi:undecaprenyl-diphosphatase